jgi:alkylation response protein AidB-like acyl-CoA dehydrogenase
VTLAKTRAAEVGLVLCELSSGQVQKEAVQSVDPSRPTARLTFSSTPAELLGECPDGYAAYRDLINRAAVLLAFEQVGAADRALSIARNYSLERFAFGRPIGANQAIKHKLADIYTRNEVARAHAYYGAWAISAESPAIPLAAAGARVAASDAFTFAAQENIQTHGGIGFTWESDCQLFYRRARLYALALGSSDNWKEQIVRSLESANT